MDTNQISRRPETAPPARSSSRTYMWGGIALVLVGAVLLALSLAANTLATTTTTTAAYDGVDRIEFDLSASGDVEVVGADTDRVEVERTVRSLFGGTRVVQDQIDATLRIESGCRMSVMSIGCRAEYLVTVPHEMLLAGSASNGALEVVGVVGQVDLSTSNGDITFADGQDRVTLRTSNGRIEVRDTRSDHLEVVTSNGDVWVEAATAPETLVAQTSNGRIDVLLPDDTAYAVEANTSNGRTDIEVPTDPASDAVVEVRTSNGNISIRPSD
ncbi:MAG TPA: DUF4097 family beta strand repeat-containing protein [Egicoccus sp.]|nr:DUF4097 family beta strand repeat-containing protein [Egicoccus sp.]HSK23834.1 DUF4097 family beta strand repeat-containing protein [Egicoccus sp.]